jgi:hypothetical protein
MSVSQVAISKWKRGGQIPNEREIELLKIAEIYWTVYIDLKEGPGWEFEDVVNSRWNVLIQSEENQEDWYEFISEILTPKKILDRDGEYSKNYFFPFIRECILLLNDIGLNVPSSPKSINLDDTHSEVYDVYFDLLLNWMRRICQLQTWFFNTLPKRNTPTNTEYFDVFDNLYKVALVQIIDGNRTSAHMPDLDKFIDETEEWVNHTIESWMYWASQGALPLWEDAFDEIKIINLKFSKDPKAQTNESISKNITKPASTDEDESYAYWSEAERKIYKGIKNNERLLKELLGKLSKQEKE